MATHTRTLKKQTGLIAPSILSADFSKLAQEVQEVEAAGADWLHLDVMDGHFVPNLTFGPVVVKALRPYSQLPFDCHLMVSEPEKWIESFAEAGANWITVHAESTPHLDRVIHQIKEAGCKAGVSLNPASPLSLIEEILDEVDLVLIMSVNPGFGGQKYIDYVTGKVERLAKMRGDRSFLIEIDGGIQPKNIGLLKKLGVDVFVVGSAVFSAPDRKQAILDLRNSF
jgi:ribulose-phosphate 3-epimerase